MSFGDVAAASVHAPEIAATLVAAYATGGMSLKYQIAADLAAAAAGRTSTEVVEY